LNKQKEIEKKLKEMENIMIPKNYHILYEIKNRKQLALSGESTPLITEIKQIREENKIIFNRLDNLESTKASTPTLISQEVAKQLEVYKTAVDSKFDVIEQKVNSIDTKLANLQKNQTAEEEFRTFMYAHFKKTDNIPTHTACVTPTQQNNSNFLSYQSQPQLQQQSRTAIPQHQQTSTPNTQILATNRPQY
jgi:hypothetical protein